MVIFPTIILMKKKVFLLFLLLLLLLSIPYSKGAYVFVNKSVCDVPITYRLGIIDNRFNVSADEFLKDIQESEEIWEKPIGKNIYQFDPNGEISINLIFDERQELHSKIDSLEGQLKGGKSTLDSQINQYESLAAEFKQNLAGLNEKITYWNSKDGAPKDVYEELKKEQADLQSQADKLNAMAKSLNLETSQYNTQVGSLNKTVDTFNQVLQGKPEEGIWKPAEKRIDIYFSFDHDELVHTLAHELGHGRGLEHVQTEGAIMHAFTNKNTEASGDDVLAMSAVCVKNYAKEYLRNKSSRFFYGGPKNP